MLDICEAIRNRCIVTFNYEGSTRMVEPHLFGVDSSGNETLNGWQLSGGNGVGFRDFYAFRISNLSITDLHFGVPRPGYDLSDQTIARVICCL